MLKDALQYLVGLAMYNEYEHDGIYYTDKPLYLVKPPALLGLSTWTLQGLVDYHKMLFDKRPEKAKGLIVHVVNPRNVHLMSWCGDDQTRTRQTHIIAESKRSDFPYNDFIDQESFIINLNANFVQTDELLDLIKKASLIVTINEASEDDDGRGQKVIVKSGVSLNREIEQKTIIKLNPITTFNEVDQPEDEFVFRVRKAEDGQPATMALFKTQNSAVDRIGVENVKNWLQANLPKGVPIIA